MVWYKFCLEMLPLSSPHTWHAFSCTEKHDWGLSCTLKINGTILSHSLFFPMQISLCLADCHFSAHICSSAFCHRSWLWELPFLKWHKFVSLYLAHMSPPWERREEGSCGGMIWYELKLFPNRLQRVWSCPLFVWWVASTSISLRRACIILHQLFLPIIVLFFTVKYSASNNNACIFSMTLWLKVSQPCYLWLVGRGHLIVFPCSVDGMGLLRVWSVSVILHPQPQVFSQSARLRTERGNDCAFCSTLYSLGRKW